MTFEIGSSDFRLDRRTFFRRGDRRIRRHRPSSFRHDPFLLYFVVVVGKGLWESGVRLAAEGLNGVWIDWPGVRILVFRTQRETRRRNKNVDPPLPPSPMGSGLLSDVRRGGTCRPTRGGRVELSGDVGPTWSGRGVGVQPPDLFPLFPGPTPLTLYRSSPFLSRSL